MSEWHIEKLYEQIDSLVNQRDEGLSREDALRADLERSETRRRVQGDQLQKQASRMVTIQKQLFEAAELLHVLYIGEPTEEQCSAVARFIAMNLTNHVSLNREKFE